MKIFLLFIQGYYIDCPRAMIEKDPFKCEKINTKNATDIFFIKRKLKDHKKNIKFYAGANEEFNKWLIQLTNEKE